MDGNPSNIPDSFDDLSPESSRGKNGSQKDYGNCNRPLGFPTVAVVYDRRFYGGSQKSARSLTTYKPGGHRPPLQWEVESRLKPARADHFALCLFTPLKTTGRLA